MYCDIVDAKYLSEYSIWLGFWDGMEGEVDLHSQLYGPVFDSLKTIDEFKRFSLHPDLHTITWENGADFAPEFLYDLVKTSKHAKNSA